MIYSPRRADRAFLTGIEEVKRHGVTVESQALHPYAGLGPLWTSLERARRASADYDVTHLHGAWAGLVGRLSNSGARRCIVYSPHGGAFHPRPGGLYWFGRMGERVLARKTAAYVVASGYEEDRLRQIQGGRAEIVRIPHARSIDPVPEGARSSARTFGVVGRLVPEKRVDLAIDAFDRAARDVDGATLVVVGEGAERASLTEDVARRGLASSVSFMGYVEDKHAIYSSFDVLLVPSDSEAFGLVAAEAQSFGIPTIAADSGGIREIVVDGENGVLLPTRDAASMARAMVDVASDPSKYESLSKNAWAGATRRHAWDAVARDYVALYRRLVRTFEARSGQGEF
jgi:glycosyltransferase involved in cell wall biosynthesis